MATVKISVLVPIYNIERYLPECLASLVNQTLKEIEIICINDGSTDDSLKIIKSYAKKDKRIIVIDKENSGYGDSMNCGLKSARGEFIGIVEPDDFVDLNAFEKMYKIALEKQAEIVKANFYRYATNKKKDIEKRELFLKNEVGRLINPEKNRHIFFQQPSIWSAIYRADFLRKKDIMFLPSKGAAYQDAGFNFKVFAAAERVVFVDDAFLHYRQDNPDSSVKSKAKMYAVKEEYDEVERYLKQKGLLHKFGRTLAIVRMGGYIWNIRRLEKGPAIEFAKVIKKEYSKYEKMGYFKIQLEDDEDAKFIMRSMIIRHPNWYVRTRLVYELKDRLLRFAWRCGHRVI